MRPSLRVGADGLTDRLAWRRRWNSMEEGGWLRSGREGACYRQGPLSQNSTVGGFKP